MFGALVVRMPLSGTKVRQGLEDFYCVLDVSQAVGFDLKDFKTIAVPVAQRMGKGEEDQVGNICTGLCRQRWHLDQGVAVEGKVTRDLMGPEPASPADRLDEAMREQEASRMTSGVPLPEAQAQEGMEMKSSLLLLLLRCWTTKWTCHGGRWIHGSHRKSRVLALSVGVISKS